MKGLRDDKKGGIPTEDIVNFFVNNISVAKSNFDDNFLINNIYNELYKIGNLEEYIAIQTKNVEYRNILAADGTLFISNSKEEITSKLSMHYINLRNIFDSLISNMVVGNDGVVSIPSMSHYNCAHILRYSPPASFFIYPSYEKLYSGIVGLVNCERLFFKSNYPFLNDVRKIIKLTPNINIPLDLIRNLFNEAKDYDDIISGLRLGFSRYALFATEKFYPYFIPNNIDGYSSDYEFPDYLNDSFLDRIDFILNEVELAATEITDENVENQKVNLRNSAIYKNLDLKGALEKTNEYIKEIYKLKASVVNDKPEQS
jgi:hypothetical protein